jgi:hypothetical protein
MRNFRLDLELVSLLAEVATRVFFLNTAVGVVSKMRQLLVIHLYMYP